MPVRDLLFGKRKSSSPAPSWGPRFVIGTTTLLFDSSLTLTIPSPTPSANVTNASGSVFSTGNISTLSKSAYADGTAINVSVPTMTLYLMDGDDPTLGMPANYASAALYLYFAQSNPGTWGHLILDSTTITIPDGTLSLTESDISRYSTPTRRGDGIKQPFLNFGCTFDWSTAAKATIKSTISSIAETAASAKLWNASLSSVDVETTYASNLPLTPPQSLNTYSNENSVWAGLISPVNKGSPNYPTLDQLEQYYFIQAGQRIFKKDIVT